MLRGREALAVLARGKHPHVLGIDLLPGGQALSRAIVEQRGEVAPVAIRGVRRQASLVAQACQVPLDAARERPAGHASRAVTASLTISPMRTRKSVLIVGR